MYVASIFKYTTRYKIKSNEMFSNSKWCQYCVLFFQLNSTSIFSKKSNRTASGKILDSVLTRKIPLEYVAWSSKTRQQGMGGRVARDDLFSSQKAPERMVGKATRQPFSVSFTSTASTKRENLQTRWVLMASRVSKFDSKEAVPGAQDTTRLRKFFRTDSRGELRLGPARTIRTPHLAEAASTFRDLFRCDWCSRLEKEKPTPLGIIGGRFTSRSSIKRKELSSFDRRELDRFTARRYSRISRTRRWNSAANSLSHHKCAKF